MSKEKFIEWSPRSKRVKYITQTAIDIIEEYHSEGYTLSLRQLYYQMVARAHIPNQANQYTNLGRYISQAREAGMIDWNAIEDRNRQVERNAHWKSPKEILKSAADSFAIDKWKNQPHLVFVMVEKDALSGVIEPVCSRLDVPFSANKGYASASHLYKIAKQISKAIEFGQKPVVLYFGDHDPSGLDMDRDIIERLTLYSGYDAEQVAVERLALTRQQIDQYKPPPDPAKISDPRAKWYIEKHGNQSWELDALEPRVLANLVESNILAWRDDDIWDADSATEDAMISNLKTLARIYKE